MPRYELVEGTSSKFWQIDLDGSSFTTTYGKIGTAGQSTAKSFDSPAKAQKEHDKLVAEKTKKGYALAGAEAAAPKPAPSAVTDVLVPTAWKKRVHPRRGYPSAAGKTKLDAKAGAAVRAHYETVREKLLAGTADTLSDAALIRAVDERFTKGSGPSDVGVEAGVGAIVRFGPKWDSPRFGDEIVDEWVAAKGVAFAVDAALASSSIGCGIVPPTNWESSKHYVLGPLCPKLASTFGSPGFARSGNDVLPTFIRLRRLLVEASEDDYAAARDVALRHREAPKDYGTRVLATYLFPTERAWVERDVAEYAAQRRILVTGDLQGCYGTRLRLLLTTITRFDDLLAMNGVRAFEELLEKDVFELPASPPAILTNTTSSNYLASILEGLGADVVPLCRWGFLKWDRDADLAMALAAVPTDEALQLLQDHAKEKHVKAALAVRLAATPLAAPPRVEAAAGTAPAVLATPPWENAKSKKKTAPKPITGLTQLAYEPSFAWSDAAEKERFALTNWDPKALEPGGYLEVLQKGKHLPQEDWRTWSEATWRKEMNTDWERRFALRHGPERFALDLLEERANHQEYAYEFCTAIARFEARVLPLVVAQAKKHAKEPEVHAHVAPFDVPEIAPALASAFHVKKTRPAIEAWFLRHPRAAAVGLIPAAVGPKSDATKAAIAALQAIVAGGEEAVVREVASEYGADVASALDAILGEDLRLAKAPTKAPIFWTPARLPQILLTNGGALTDAPLENLRVMLSLSEIGKPLPGLREALAACDRGSLAAFGWALFDAWQNAGSPNEEKWALSALAFLGDDDAVRKLTPLIRKWPGESAHPRAVLGLEVLGAIGTDLALMSIHGISERLKFPALKEIAQKQIGTIAKRKGLSVAELEDRLVPTLGLDDEGSLQLGKFTVGFDEVLAPFVRDATNAKLAALPKGTAKEALETFAALKKDVRALATTQLARLERAMTSQRRWTTADFELFLVRHPLLVHVVRRLLWGAYDGAKLVATFRVAEDRTLATIDDELCTLSPAHTIGIVHPTQLDDAALAKWGQVFGEYEVLQPFPQLGRSRHTAADAKRILGSLVGVTVPSGKVLGLTATGWRRGPALDSGFIGWMERTTSLGEARLLLQQGFIAGAAGENPEQTLEGFDLGDKKPLAAVVANLPLIEASELAYSVSGLTS